MRISNGLNRKFNGGPYIIHMAREVLIKTYILYCNVEAIYTSCTNDVKAQKNVYTWNTFVDFHLTFI